MRFWYADANSAEDVNLAFDALYGDATIDGLPAECQSPAYFVEMVIRWKNGGEHVWLASSDKGSAVAILRAELYGEGSYLIHISAIPEARGRVLMQLCEIAMKQLLATADGKVELIACLDPSNIRAQSFARIMGCRKLEEESTSDLIVYTRYA